MSSNENIELRPLFSEKFAYNCRRPDQGEEELTKEMLERIEEKYNDYTKETLNRILNEYSEARFILELLKNDIEEINPKPKNSEAQNQLKRIVDIINELLIQYDNNLKKRRVY